MSDVECGASSNNHEGGDDVGENRATVDVNFLVDVVIFPIFELSRQVFP